MKLTLLVTKRLSAVKTIKSFVCSLFLTMNGIARSMVRKLAAIEFISLIQGSTDKHSCTLKTENSSPSHKARPLRLCPDESDAEAQRLEALYP